MERTLQQLIEQFGGVAGVAVFAVANVLFMWRTKVNAESAAARQAAENTAAIRSAYQVERDDRQRLQTRIDEIEAEFERRAQEAVADRLKQQSCIANLQKELAETQEQLEATRSRIAALNEQLDMVRSERAVEAKTLEAARLRNEELERKLTKTEVRLTETTQALNEAKERISSQERRIVELETRNAVWSEFLGRVQIVNVVPKDPTEPTDSVNDDTVQAA